MGTRTRDPLAGSESFSLQEERANIFVHLLGFFFGLGAIPFLLKLAWLQHTRSFLSVIIYACCFLMLFVSSALYHSMKQYRLKRIFKKIDRISIYFLIAGTYTALIRYYLYDSTGITLLYILWSLVLAGIFFELFFPGKFDHFSVGCYLGMGLLFLTVPRHFFSTMPGQIIGLILSGVALYSLGIVFYIWKKWPFHHAIWHFCVLCGGLCHFFAILQTVD